MLKISLKAKRIDELVDILQEEIVEYPLSDVLNIGIEKYKKEFFIKLKELLKDRENLPKANVEIVLNFYLIHSDYVV